MLSSLQRKVIITIVFSPLRMDFALVSPFSPTSVLDRISLTPSVQYQADK